MTLPPQAQPQRPAEPQPAPPSAASGLIWLASYPKSGNTWTRSLLHNLIAIMRGEFDADWDINALNEVSTSTQGMKRYTDHAGKPWDQLTRDEIALLRPVVQAEIEAEAAGLVFVKTHNALMDDHGVPVVNFKVTAGAVYIVRNPLDVAISYAHHLSRPIDEAIELMADSGHETAGSDKQIHEVMGSWSEHVASWTAKPHRAVHVMRYEDMLAAPATAFGGLARFLLLAPSAEELERAVAASSFEALQRQEQDKGFREKPEQAKAFFREGRAGQWREVLTRRQIRRISRDHEAQMQRFGYAEALHGKATGALGWRLG